MKRSLSSADEPAQKRRKSLEEDGEAEAAPDGERSDAAPADNGAEANDSDDDRPVLPKSGKVSVRRGAECPYLDSVARANLDFDFEKCCSVSLTHVNVYACLVCGKYYQGRGLHTHAYTHALEAGHHLFMRTDNGRVYCLPDNYEVQDRSLDDIRHVLNPTFTPQEVAALSGEARSFARALDGSEYLPGLVGMNNMKANDYANVVVQALARVGPLRDFFLLPSGYASCKSPLVQRFGELMRKLWNPRNFKGQVSPHEFMQAVIAASKKRFTIEAQADPVDFWSWLLNTLHSDLTGGRLKAKSIITDCFQGELEVTTEKGTGKGAAAKADANVTERLPFLLLGLDLPPPPLFKDAMEKNIIPQVPIFSIMRKFDGESWSDDLRAGRRQFRLTRLPRFLVLHMRRFTRNNFFREKNPTIVNFPVRNLELRDIVPLPAAAPGAPLPVSKYDLVANVVHEGRAEGGAYKSHIHRRGDEQWYEVQDLSVSEILPQMVALSEAYLQVYQMKEQ